MSMPDIQATTTTQTATSLIPLTTNSAVSTCNCSSQAERLSRKASRLGNMEDPVKVGRTTRVLLVLKMAKKTESRERARAGFKVKVNMEVTTIKITFELRVAKKVESEESARAELKVKVTVVVTIGKDSHRSGPTHDRHFPHRRLPCLWTRRCCHRISCKSEMRHRGDRNKKTAEITSLAATLSMATRCRVLLTRLSTETEEDQRTEKEGEEQRKQRSTRGILSNTRDHSHRQEIQQEEEERAIGQKGTEGVVRVSKTSPDRLSEAGLSGILTEDRPRELLHRLPHPAPVRG